jgi:polysaccharide export outer membrane protein
MKDKIREILRENTEKNILGVVVSKPNQELIIMRGIPGSGKAHRIKLIRGEKANPEVYLIDLSTIDGMKKGDIVLQGNDIIYVEPVNDYITNFTTRIQSYFFILTTIFILRSFIN